MTSKDVPENEDLLSMEEAIEQLKTTRSTFYRWLRSGQIKGMKVGRQWRFYPQDIARFLNGEQPQIAIPTSLAPLKQQLQAHLQAIQADTSDLQDLGELEQSVHMILRLALLKGASDLHLEPIYLNQSEHKAILRLRIAGQLQTQAEIDRRLLAPLLEQFKILAACDPHRSDSPQEGQFSLSMPSADKVQSSRDTQFEARLQTLPTTLGESLCLRLINRSLAESISLEQLRLSPQVSEAIQAALKKSWGLIIASGPTGSGKTTTLYACLNQVAAPEIKAIAIEDVSESYFPWVSSVPVDRHKGQTYTSVMKAAMQADPDVLMVSELQDADSLEAVLRIALTGHLVLTSLHVESALQGLQRLIEISGNAYTVSESVQLIINQRLIRRLCPACQEQRPLTAEDQAHLQQLHSRYALDTRQIKQLSHAKGCSECQQQGYRGRMLIAEALSMDTHLRQALQHDLKAPKLTESLLKELQASGWRSWIADGLDQVQAGTTSLKELLRVIGI